MRLLRVVSDVVVCCLRLSAAFVDAACVCCCLYLSLSVFAVVSV